MTAAVGAGRVQGTAHLRRSPGVSELELLAVLGFAAGFANLLSHPVISGFITASGIPIATSQLKHSVMRRCWRRKLA
jgi:SulP family sulfate permease